MKTKFKRIGKQSLSVILAVMMMVSTMLVGMVSTNAGATVSKYQFVISGSDNDTANCTNGSLKGIDKLPVYYDVVTGIYSVTVANTYFQQYNNFFTFTSDGTNKGFVTIKDNSKDSIKIAESLLGKFFQSDSNVCEVKENGGKHFIRVSVKDPSAESELVISYDSGKHTFSIDPAAASNYTVSAKGQYTYDGTNYQECDASQVTVSSTSVATGSSVTVTANEKAGYKFMGWEGTNGQISNPSASSTEFTPTADNAVAIAKYAKKISVNVTVAGSGSYTVNPDSATTSIAASEAFTVTFTPGEGNKISDLTVNATDMITALVDNNLSLKAGVTNETDNQMEINVTFAEKSKYSFSCGYVTGCNNSMGTISGTLNGDYEENTSITVTAAAKPGYTFAGWYSDINGTGSALSTEPSYTFNLTADKAVFAKFTENTGIKIDGLYLIYSTKDSDSPEFFTEHCDLYYGSDKIVYAYLNKDNNFDPQKTYKFMISTQIGANAYNGTDNYNKDTGSVNVTTAESDKINVGQNSYNYGQPNHAYNFGSFSVNRNYQSEVSSVKIELGYYNNGKIQESADNDAYTRTYNVIPTLVDGVKIYAKYGTIRSDYQKYADMAKTELSADNGVLSNIITTNPCRVEAYAPKGSTITVTTTITSPYNQTYYVKAFCINGISYGIIDKTLAETKRESGVYTCTYTIPEDCTDSIIEITPIYYYFEESNTVTFYVKGFDEKVQEVWGNTIAVQAWYQGGSEEGLGTLDTKNALGGYPGQPLVLEGGKYSMQIPKYLDKDAKNPVQGITLNNYVLDEIHSKIGKSNAQTYDFNDFVMLAGKKDADNIIFDFRYRSTGEPNDPKETFKDSTKGPLEDLTDYYDNIVDLFGTKIDDSEKNNPYITVISKGYQNAGFGESYATEWTVYDTDGTYIATINCAELLAASVDNVSAFDNNKYKDAYTKLQACRNKPVKIAYEKSIYSGGKPADRSDGRWYYSKNTDKITSNVIIEYESGNTYLTDYFKTGTNEGSKTGAKAYFTNIGYNGKTTCTGTVGGGNFSVKAEADSTANYYFIGWYLKTSTGSYTPVSDQAVCDIPMTGNDTYVARFKPTPTGTLTLSHKLLTNSAYGKTFIMAEIVNNEDTVVKTFAETQSNIVIPEDYVKYPSTDKLRITLKTVPYGKDTVEGFYYTNDTTKPVSGTSGENGKAITLDDILISSLFENKNSDSEGIPDYQLISNNRTYYSNITSKPESYTITYNYQDRSGTSREYVIKDEVSGKELEEMWAENKDENIAANTPNADINRLSKAFITRKAPFVSNFGQEITWNIDTANISGYTATVEAKTTPSKVKILALKANDWETNFHEILYGTLAKNENGDYLYRTGTDEFPESKKFNEKSYDFSFWAIFDKIEDANTFNREVENYMKGSPAKDKTARLTAITKLPGYSSLIAKSYSNEFNYICYQDYFIVPVYAGYFSQSEIKEAQASIRLLEYTRNQWTNANGVNGNGEAYDQNGKTDYLYTDFALSFDKDQLLIQTSKNIKVGIVLEVVDQYNNVDDLKSYTTESNTKEIGDKVKEATHDGNIGISTFNGNSRNLYRYEITNKTISNKNRIEYYLRFENSTQSKQNVVKVYSYIYDTITGEIHLSAPVYMNMYDIATLTYITSNLANVNIDSGSAQ